MVFKKCLFRLVVDLSKAGRPAPQKKPRTKAKPFQTATVSNPIRARRSYFEVALARPEWFGTFCKLVLANNFIGLGPMKLSPTNLARPCQNVQLCLVHRAQQNGVERIPRRGHSAWARKSGEPAWASRNSSPIQNFIWN